MRVSGRRRNHPFVRAALFGLAALSTMALGVYGALAIPIAGRHPFDPEDCSPVVACFPPNYHTPLRVLCLVAGIVVALALSAAARRRIPRAA